MASQPRAQDSTDKVIWLPHSLGEASGSSGYTAAESTNSGDGGGGGDPMIDIAGLKQNVGFLNWAVAAIFSLGLASIVGSYVLLDGEMHDVNEQVAGQVKTLEAIEKSVIRIEDKVDGNQLKASDSAKPTR